MQKNKSNLEFIALMASLMCVVALSIDALLPAIQEIGKAINSFGISNNQKLVTYIFLGLGFGQLIFGPLSDSFGRKSMVYVGFIIFIFASFICVNANSLEVMLVGRFLQGFGLAAPRTLSVAMIRDLYSGNYMARVMSFVVVIFILVPVFAPAIGKLILDYFGWKTIFYSQLIFGVLVMFWMWKRQEETLKKNKRIKFKLALFISGTKEFLKYRQSVIFTIISGFISGSFIVYLSGSQQIFQVQYGLVAEYPVIFGSMALTAGFATFVNGSLVVKLGMHKLVNISMIFYALIPLVYMVLFYGKPNPNLTMLLIFLGSQFFAIGFLFGNLRAIAMEPIGHIAGIGAALNGFISTLMAVPIANYIGNNIKLTAYPIFVGFFGCGLLSLLLILLFRSKKKSSKI